MVEFVDPDIRALAEVPSCAEAALILRLTWPRTLSSKPDLKSLSDCELCPRWVIPASLVRQRLTKDESRLG